MEVSEQCLDKPKWFHYLFSFLAGLFLTNSLPHLFNGISGTPFPSPFATPPGVGLSTPTENVMWASINLIIGTIMFFLGNVSSKSIMLRVAFLIGFFLMIFYLANYFGEALNP